ncbi:hypothetical protein V8G54_010853 [Vigna mungo]|uniref:Fe2OG dioxygenase domain-containing protein n=1 Tax=Vigna mungo TaxID=3915 RepID=A0AAQ3NZ96_VIGMU
MGEVDPAFIQDLQHRPKLGVIEAEEIPVIDLSPVTNEAVSDPSSIERLVKEIGSACKEWGFFQVINHGVPLVLRENIEKASRMFFSQSVEEKRKVSRDERNAMGYYDTEHTKNVRDWKEVFDSVAQDPTPVPLTPHEHDHRLTYWSNSTPHYPPHLRSTITKYVKETEKLSLKLMELIALSLGLEAKRFEEYFVKDQTSLFRLNYYPRCPSPHLALGVGPHKDVGALTVLAQDEVEGLELLQVWSNDAYESPEHRVVVNSEKERYSYPFFLFPAQETEVKPMEELINDQNPSKYRPYKWGKFLAHRFSTNFKKQVGENIQILHYKIK